VKERRPAIYAALKVAVQRLAAERKHAADRLKRHGVSEVTRKLAAQLWRIVFARDEVLVYVSGPRAVGPARTGELPPDSVTYKGSLEDLAELAVAHPEYIDREGLERARRRLRAGDRVYVARCGGQVAHVHWAGLRTEVAPTEAGGRLRIPLDPPEVLAYDAWTAPQFRGRGLHRLVMQVVLAETRAIGLRQWCYCVAGNTASRRAIEGNGFRCAYRLVRVRLCGRTWHRAEDLRNEQTPPDIRRESRTHEPVVGG
jgi:GNAT superfamily N-acetyltransferase